MNFNEIPYIRTVFVNRCSDREWCRKSAQDQKKHHFSECGVLKFVGALFGQTVWILLSPTLTTSQQSGKQAVTERRGPPGVGDRETEMCRAAFRIYSKRKTEAEKWKLFRKREGITQVKGSKPCLPWIRRMSEQFTLGWFRNCSA